MKKSLKSLILLLSLFLAPIATQCPVSAAPWVTAYYSWDTLPTLPPADVDMTSITHLVYFSLSPNADGTLFDNGADTTHGGSSATSIDANADAFVSAVHAAGDGKCALICIGGGGSEANFESAMSSTYQATFISNIKSWIVAHGFDGVDIDMEPLPESDLSLFQSFITNLRASFGGSYLITVAALTGSDAHPDIYAGVADDIDQINIETYDMSNDWDGWVSWYNSALYDGGATFPDSDELLPSCDNQLARYLAAGISPSRLAIATAFYGYVWTGVTGPDQNLSGLVDPTPVNGGVPTYPYSELVSTYSSSPEASYVWNTSEYAPYFTQTTGTTEYPLQFVSFDDPTLVADKVKYVISHGLGGLMCFHVGQQYIPTNPTGSQQPLLEAIDGAMLTGSTNTLNDHLNNFDDLYEMSDNWMIDDSNPSYFLGDTGRACRTVDDTEYIDYHYANISQFNADVYTWDSSITSVTFWVSYDNASTFTEVPVSATAKTLTTSPWGYQNVTNTTILPVGVTDLKVQFSATGEAWDPQLSNLTVTYQ